MSDYLAPQDIDDLVTLTHNTMIKPRTWNDFSLTKQKYCITDRYFTGKKLPMKSGPQVQWKLQTSIVNYARAIGLFQQDTHAVGNVMESGVCPWAIYQNNYTYDVMEPDFQSSERDMLIDAILIREHQMYNGWFDVLENAFWKQPAAAASSSNPQELFGIPYWIQKNATLGFNGGDPSIGACGGISTSTYPGWKNYTGTYGAVTRGDLISKLIKATDFCRFEPPHAYPQTSPSQPRYAMYTTHPVVEAAYQFLDSRNDKITDLGGASAGRATFRSIPLEWVPALTNSDSPAYDSSNPVYGVDWNSMGLYFLKGRDMVRTGPEKVANQVNVRSVFVHSSLQLVCDNRRANFNLYQA